MIRTRLSTNRQPRRGFTLIELLVVISIIAVLVSLIAPAVQAARRTARKLECLNNMRQIGLALQAFSATSGNLPYLVNNMPVTNSSGTTGTIYSAGWPLYLLPALDDTATLKNIKANAFAPTSPYQSDALDIATSEQIWRPAFTCPDDNDSFRIPGGLSFVLNAGFISGSVWGKAPVVPATTSVGETLTLYHQPFLIDWNGDTNFSATGQSSPFDAVDQAVAISAGVFTRPTAGNSFQPTLDAVSTGDGQSNTLMVTENLNAGPWYATNSTLPNSPHLNTGVNTLGFGENIPVSSEVPVTGLFTWTTTSPTYLKQDLTNYDSTVVTAAGINTNLGTAVIGSAPRPSSQHAGGVNIIMCDGSGRYLNESLDRRVYGKLLTSNGVTYGEATLDSRGF